MTKIAGYGSASESGSISQRHRSPDPDADPHQNVTDPQHCLFYRTAFWHTLIFIITTGMEKILFLEGGGANLHNLFSYCKNVFYLYVKFIISLLFGRSF
jgi:hypothetical protein